MQTNIGQLFVAGIAVSQIQSAMRTSGLTFRIVSHTFRPFSFAFRLVLSWPIRIKQPLVGHQPVQYSFHLVLSDVKISVTMTDRRVSLVQEIVEKC